MNTSRSMSLLAVAAAVLATTGYFLFSTRDSTPPLTEVEEATPTVESTPEPAEPAAPKVEAPQPTPTNTSKSAPAYYDPYAGKDLHRLHGYVRDAVTGDPIPFFATHLAKVSEGSIEYIADTQRNVEVFGNSKGGFVIRGLKEDRYNLLVRVDGYRDAVLTNFAIPTAESLQIQLERGSYVEVTVVDSEGDGLGGVEVRIDPVRIDDQALVEANPLPTWSPPARRMPSVRLRRTDDNGKTLFSDLPPGVYKVELVNQAMGAQPSPDFYLAQGSSYPVNFQVRDLNTLLARVRDQEGNPLGNVQIRLWSKGDDRSTFRIETDRHGEGRVEFVAQGLYTMRVWKPGFYRLGRTLNVPFVSGVHEEEIILKADPTNGYAERHPTIDQLRRLQAGESATEVFGIIEDR